MKPATQATPKVIEHPEKQEGIFDFRTHIRDAATGRLIARQDYAMHCFGDNKMLERPIGSGNMYKDNGQAIGRWSKDAKAGWIKLSDSHIDAEATTHLRNAREDAHILIEENEELKKELAALSKERDDIMLENMKLTEEKDQQAGLN